MTIKGVSFSRLPYDFISGGRQLGLVWPSDCGRWEIRGYAITEPERSLRFIVAEVKRDPVGGRLPRPEALPSHRFDTFAKALAFFGIQADAPAWPEHAAPPDRRAPFWRRLFGAK